jgi:hypothetical protein
VTGPFTEERDKVAEAKSDKYGMRNETPLTTVRLFDLNNTWLELDIASTLPMILVSGE